MKTVFLGLLTLVGGFVFVSTAQASHTDHSQGDTYNINVNVNGADSNSRYHSNNYTNGRYNYVQTHSPYVSHVSGYGSVRSLPSSRSYKSYTPQKNYNTYGQQYNTNNFYKTNGSRYSDAYHTYNQYNNTNTYGNGYTTYNRVDAHKKYTPMKERHIGGTCNNH